MLVRQVKILALLVLATASLSLQRVSGQLPDDIQRELNQNLAEQARIQAMRQQHQRQMQARLGRQRSGQQQQQPATTGSTHDPNNYSYQQVSPPIQYSYYQPYGDAATTAAPAASGRQQPVAPLNIDLNNLNFDLPQPQAQVSSGGGAAHPATEQRSSGDRQQHFTPSFTGAGGLPVLQPTANSANNANSYAPVGAPPLAPQAQQGPPLTEADFKDITSGENYGAPGGNDFGLGDAASLPSSGNNKRASSEDSTDAQLREFGMLGGADMPGMDQPARSTGRRQPVSSSPQINIPDFGSFNPIGAGPKQRLDDEGNSDAGTGGDAGAGGFGGNDNFGNFDNLGGASGDGSNAPSSGQSSGGGSGNDFDFASQPSSNRAGGEGGDPTAAAGMGGGAPGSLQSLLGSGFPGLGGGGGSALDDFARSNNDPQAQLSGQSKQRNDDGALDIADLGEKSDQFSGADLGGFEQPSPSGDQDFNYGSASDQQPRTVPYRDSNPQPVGTIFAVTQPQSMTQTRYNALPDKGTFQDYPAYLVGGNDFSAVARVVDSTPQARAPGAGRYSLPSPKDLAPEYRQSNGQLFDYNRAPDLQ